MKIETIETLEQLVVSVQKSITRSLLIRESGFEKGVGDYESILLLISQVFSNLSEICESLYPGRPLSLPNIHQLQSELETLRGISNTDIAAALNNDPATEDAHEVILCYPGFRATVMQRFAHSLWKFGVPLLPRMMTSLAHQQTGIDIHPGAKIGKYFFIDHGTGVVIGETAEIGDYVTLYQGVTLGAKKFERDKTGRVLKSQPRHPILEDGVTVYSGATILGRIRVGAGSVIGGNVWLTESVPSHSRITQQHYLSEKFIDGAGI